MHSAVLLKIPNNSIPVREKRNSNIKRIFIGGKKRCLKDFDSGCKLLFSVLEDEFKNTGFTKEGKIQCIGFR